MVDLLFSANSLIGEVQGCLVVLSIFAGLYIWNRWTGGKHIEWSRGHWYFDDVGQNALFVAILVFGAFVVWSAWSFLSLFWE
jgi:hypothetical protein